MPSLENWDSACTCTCACVVAYYVYMYMYMYIYIVYVQVYFRSFSNQWQQVWSACVCLCVIIWPTQDLCLPRWPGPLCHLQVSVRYTCMYMYMYMYMIVYDNSDQRVSIGNTDTTTWCKARAATYVHVHVQCISYFGNGWIERLLTVISMAKLHVHVH